MSPHPRPWWLIATISAALNALLPLGGGLLLLAVAVWAQNHPRDGFGSLAVIYIVVAAVLIVASLPYVVAWIGLRKRQRWGIWLVGVLALLQGSWEAIILVRAVIRAQTVYSHVTLVSLGPVLIVSTHVALLTITVLAAAKLLAATRAEQQQRGFPVTVAGA